MIGSKSYSGATCWASAATAASPCSGAGGGVRLWVDQIAASLGPHCWTRYCAGAKGPRLYDWAFTTLHPDDGPGHRWLLLRRLPDHSEPAYYR